MMDVLLQVELLSRPEAADSDMMGSESDVRSEATTMSELHGRDAGEESSSRPPKVWPPPSSLLGPFHWPSAPSLFRQAHEAQRRLSDMHPKCAKASCLWSGCWTIFVSEWSQTSWLPHLGHSSGVSFPSRNFSFACILWCGTRTRRLHLSAWLPHVGFLTLQTA